MLRLINPTDPLSAAEQHVADASARLGAELRQHPESVLIEEYAALEIYLRQRAEALRVEREGR